jgi:hypothetical protein
VCFDFAEVCADACFAASFEGVCDGVERVAVDVVYVSVVLQREPRSGKTWHPAGFALP